MSDWTMTLLNVACACFVLGFAAGARFGAWVAARDGETKR